jgi:hemerythrin
MGVSSRREADVPNDWTEELATGVEKLDQQHRDIFRAAAGLREAAATGRLERVPALVEAVRHYALEHFATEEREMVARHYPGLAVHRKLHKGFVDDFVRYRALLDAGGPTPALVAELARWLSTWLHDHVALVDAQLASFLRAPAG